jgi:hypothetical protein
MPNNPETLLRIVFDKMPVAIPADRASAQVSGGHEQPSTGRREPWVLNNPPSYPGRIARTIAFKRARIRAN